MVRVEHVMGMPVVVDVRDDDVSADVLDAVFDWFHWVDATFSPFKADSELSRLNRGEVALADVCAELAEVLVRCEVLAEETGGYFDAAAVAPGVVDPSGFVKGWSVDRAAALLDAAGLEHWAVNAGGDVRVRGGALPASFWRIGVQHPLERSRVAKVLDASDLAVATSGAYERGSHVLDPHGRRPPHGILSVTVTGPELGTADAYATAAFAMGAERAPHWTARLRGYDALTILADGRMLSTPGF